MHSLHFALVFASLLLIPIFTSQIAVTQHGTTVELDQEVYTWTDKVNIKIIAPDHNFDSNLIDTIGNTADNAVKITTRNSKIDNYKLVETGVDTGTFIGEVILTGFLHDADGDRTTGDHNGFDTNPRTEPLNNGGPTNGFLETKNDDGITVSFEFAKDQVVAHTAKIQWNEGEILFLEASYPTTGQGTVRVIDPDMNLNPELIDSFKVKTWSDSDSGGIDLTVIETAENSGIFQGTMYFSPDKQSSGDRLRVAEGDTVTAQYDDNTLPDYPFTKQQEFSATTFIGTSTPPLERAPASNARVVDASGNKLNEVDVNQQIQVVVELTNDQDIDQPFAYLVQIQDEGGFTVSLSWITGSLTPHQNLKPAQSWVPKSPGTYNVQIFVWQSIDNPNALSPPVSTTINVKGEKTAPNVKVNPTFDFAISAGDVELKAGESDTSKITVTKKSGNAQSVSLSCTLKIQGKCDVIPSDVIPNDFSTITIHTEESTPPDTYVGIIMGKAGNIQRSDKFTVHVLAPEKSKDKPDVKKNPIDISLVIIITTIVGGGGAAGYAILKHVIKLKNDTKKIVKPPVSSVRIVIDGGIND